MLHSVFGLLLTIGWVVFVIATLVRFWRLFRQSGPGTALKSFGRRQFLVPLTLMLSLSVVKLSLVFIYPQQVGVVVSLFADDGIREQPLRSGLHWVWPLAEKAVIYPRSWQTYTMSDRAFEGQRPNSDAITARTKDNQEVKMDISVIYRLDPEKVVDVHRFWQRRYAEDLLRPSVRGYLRREVANYTVNQVNSSERNVISVGLSESLQLLAEENGFFIENVLLRNIAFTSEYALAVERKQVELEGMTRARHEAQQVQELAKGKAGKVKILADAEADAIRITAQARADARLIQAEAEAEALNLVATALKDKENLLTYRYIRELSPKVQAVVLPNNMPLIFPLPSFLPPGLNKITGSSP